MPERVQVSPQLFRWASARSGHELAALEERFPHLDAWLRGDGAPTFKQLERFAKATYTPVGYLFLSSPPEERLPIPDFRSGPERRNRQPSANLLETIYVCQQRQNWYREYSLSSGEKPLAFVGSATVRDDVEKTAAAIRGAVALEVAARARMTTREIALRAFVEGAEAAGVMVMRNGIVQNNTHRPLDPDEFRGFALSDDIAPLVFVNAADTKSAQMFTLAHELGHIWLGKPGVSNEELTTEADESVERWCNSVAAEILVPLDEFSARAQRGADLRSELDRLAREFKVSTLVILRRFFDVGALSRVRFHKEYEAELARLTVGGGGPGGGDFYRTEVVRVGTRFSRALVASTLEGYTLFTDAFRLLGISKQATFDNLGRTLGVLV